MKPLLTYLFLRSWGLSPPPLWHPPVEISLENVHPILPRRKLIRNSTKRALSLRLIDEHEKKGWWAVLPDFFIPAGKTKKMLIPVLFYNVSFKKKATDGEKNDQGKEITLMKSLLVAMLEPKSSVTVRETVKFPAEL